MTAKEMWNILVERYPSFSNEEHIAQLKARGLHNLLQQAWDEGRKSGIKEEQMKAAKKTSQPSNLFADFFRNNQ